MLLAHCIPDLRCNMASAKGEGGDIREINFSKFAIAFFRSKSKVSNSFIRSCFWPAFERGSGFKIENLQNIESIQINKASKIRLFWS